MSHRKRRAVETNDIVNGKLTPETRYFYFERAYTGPNTYIQREEWDKSVETAAKTPVPTISVPTAVALVPTKEMLQRTPGPDDKVNNLDQGQVKCLDSGEGISIKLRKFDLPKYVDRTDLQLGSCPFKADGSLEATIICGLQKSVVDETVVYTGRLTSKKEQGIIVRRYPVDIEVSCSFCCMKGNEKESVQPNFGLIIGKVELKGPSAHFPLTLDVIGKDGKPLKKSETLSEELDKTITVRVGGAPDGLKVRAEKCWATPGDESLRVKLSHTLIENSCQSDKTVETVGSGKGGKDQDISFSLFSFTKVPNSHIKLHCDLVACKQKEDCGKCKRSL